MDRNEIEAFVQEIMLDYARQTGLMSNDAHPRRYLWTDAFAVCNYLDLFRRTGIEVYLDLSLRLVGQVHHTLGRHRDDDPRRGWISGFDELEGESHPTVRGLRIGKQLNERRPDEPPIDRLEWDRDGQYFHYLTKWMHALNCASRATGDATYTRWAIELAKAAHERFTYAPPHEGRKRMYWKMSIDLTRPLVSSMGQHDPLDGFVTYKELEAAAARDFPDSPPLDLSLMPEIAEMALICRGIDLPTDDPLGIGGLLFDASRIAQLMTRDTISNTNRLGLLENVLDSALLGMEAFMSGETLEYPAGYRLAFRELGLSIGLAAVEDLAKWIEEKPQLGGQLKPRVVELMGYMPVRKKIEQFWMDGKNREANTWIEHSEINMVMQATSLSPNGFLRI
jgi:hypothetical protein